MKTVDALIRIALEWGASAARVLPAREVVPDEGIVELCRKPLCPGYGKSAYCPPHAPPPTEVRKLIRSYRSALLFKIDVPTEILLSRDRYGVFKEVYILISRLKQYLREQGCSRIEGFAAGSCKPVFCPHDPCRVLTGGGPCRFPDLARPSMEAVGINVFELVQRVGWPIQRLNAHSDPAAVPQGLVAGLVLMDRY